MICADLLSLNEPSVSGLKNVLGWIDPVSHYADIEGIPESKKNVCVALNHVLKLIRALSGFDGVIIFYTDNEAILHSKGYLATLNSNNSICWHSVENEPRTNDFAERPFGTMPGSARAVMFQGTIPPVAGYIILKQSYRIHNVVPRRDLGWKSPYQVFCKGALPDLTFLRTPGSFAIAFDYPAFKKSFGSKFQLRGRPAVYIGEGSIALRSGYLLLDIATGKFFTTVGAVIDETRMPFREGLMCKMLNYAIHELGNLDDNDGVLQGDAGEAMGKTWGLGVPEGLDPNDLIGRKVNRSFGEHGSFLGVIKGWRLEKGYVVWDVLYSDGDSEEILWEGNFDPKTQYRFDLSDVLLPEDAFSELTVNLIEGWTRCMKAHPPLPSIEPVKKTATEQEPRHKFSDHACLLIDAFGYVKAKALVHTTKSHLKASKTGKQLSKKLQNRLAAFQRYGNGKLNESTWVSLQAAMKDGDEEEWLKALAVEWDKFVQNGVFRWTTALPGENVMKLASPCKLKHVQDLHSQTHRVRLVGQGFNAKPETDRPHLDSYSPVVDNADLLLYLNISLERRLYLKQQDLVGGYQQADASRERMLYYPPKGLFEPPWEGAVLEARRALYGDPESGRTFYLWWIDVLRKLGFRPVDFNKCWWYREDERGLIMVASIVDDSLIAFEHVSTFDEFQNDLKKEQVLADVDEVSKFGGMNIKYDRERGTLIIDQVHLIEIGAKRFGINEHTKPVSTPSEPGRVISRDDCPEPHASDEDVSQMRSMIGTLGYISNISRPLLKETVSSLSRVADNPSQAHLKAAYRALVYVYHTRHVPLVFKAGGWVGPDGQVFNSNVPVAWADASLATSGLTEFRRSPGGNVIMLNGAAISSRAGLQKTTADSSAKAEVIEVYECCREIVRIRQIYEALGTPLHSHTVLFEDNSAAISILEMTSNSSRARHFEVKYFWVHELIYDEVVNLRKCDTLLMLADGMTKALPPARFKWMEYWVQGLHSLPEEAVRSLGYSTPVVPV